ncbi:GNAT family N-acetyltransferase [Peribacillus kribbensis]|uniref:GNAT family N-acetyltransferase n=1 Tax=Peribacillus kribbensis TaxID=356658 RepID=UPI000406430C|nr:GNAT family N-acetyltransferase [Peribacillus kribbensis]
MIEIRSLERSEIDFLFDMIYESIHIPEDKPPKEVLLNSPHLKKYSEDWGRDGDRALVAVRNEQPIGAVWYRLFTEENKGYGYVDDHTPELGISVIKEARGTGAGKALMRAIVEQAGADGYDALSLSVDPVNTEAVNLYKQLGFYPCGSSGTSITMIYTRMISKD